MRTTISIDENLLIRLKNRASATGSTVSKLVEQAVRILLSREPPRSREAREFELVTFGAGGGFSKHNIDKTASLLEAEDLEKYGQRER